MRKMLGLALLLLMPSYASATTLELKSLVLNTPTTADQVVDAFRTECKQFGEPCDSSWQQRHDKMAIKCGAGGSKGDTTVCNGKTTIAGVSADANIVIGSTGLLDRIDLTISSTSYEPVLAELLAKYGQPASSKHSTLQNRFGASFDQVTTIWNGPSGEMLTVTRYAGSIEDTRINFSTLADRDLLRRVYKADPADL